jgi:hypothetical protein
VRLEVVTAGTTAVAVEAATTQGLGRITSAVVMAKADMVVAVMAVTANKAEMAMGRVDMEAMVAGTEETEAGTREVDMVVAVVEEVEGGIRDDEVELNLSLWGRRS